MPSFDVISTIDAQELDNALNQTKKEFATRYDFQGTQSTIDYGADKTTIVLKSKDKGRLETGYEIFLAKLAKRQVALRGFSADPIEPIGGQMVQQIVRMQQGIPVEKGKELIKLLKDSKLKVQGSIQADQLRITGKSRDDLQAAIALLKQHQDQVKVDLQFTNFRD